MIRHHYLYRHHDYLLASGGVRMMRARGCLNLTDTSH